MIPVGTPVAACSARCVNSASSRALPSKPRANAVATSRAALEDRPLPIGISVVIVPTIPRVALHSAATAAIYLAHCGCNEEMPLTGIAKFATSGSSADFNEIEGASVKRASITVCRLIAIGNTSPPV